VQTVQVDVGHTRYPILIGPGILGDGKSLGSRIPAGDIMVVSDKNVAKHYMSVLKDDLPRRRIAECVLPVGEQYKTLATAARIFDALVASRLNRDATVIALGGGIVGDIAGFVAASYQRGVGFVQVPTTLLAQVDSSVGGKTGVNHPGGKNLIGAFYQPGAVIADTATLKSLPERELRAGLAEVIKYGCIWDPLLFDWLDRNMAQLLALDPEALGYAIARSCTIKATVVARDEREQSVRAILNFGHTFGHALEAATGYTQYLHGEAVALGMLIATDFSHRIGIIDAAIVEKVRQILGKAGLPVEAPQVGGIKILELMQMDKKVQGGAVRLVLLQRLGRAVVTAQYPKPLLESTLKDYFG
jgi:3-dehydroquinate synthase